MSRVPTLATALLLAAAGDAAAQSTITVPPGTTQNSTGIFVTDTQVTVGGTLNTPNLLMTGGELIVEDTGVINAPTFFDPVIHVQSGGNLFTTNTNVRIDGRANIGRVIFLRGGVLSGTGTLSTPAFGDPEFFPFYRIIVATQVEPGGSGIGTLTFDSSAQLVTPDPFLGVTDNSHLVFQIVGQNADQLIVTGPLELGGDVTINVLAPPLLETRYVLITAPQITGAFANVSINGLSPLQHVEFSIDAFEVSLLIESLSILSLLPSSLALEAALGANLFDVVAGDPAFAGAAAAWPGLPQQELIGALSQLAPHGAVAGVTTSFRAVEDAGDALMRFGLAVPFGAGWFIAAQADVLSLSADDLTATIDQHGIRETVFLGQSLEALAWGIGVQHTQLNDSPMLESEGLIFGLFIAAQAGGWRVTAHAGGGEVEYDARRELSAPGLAETLSHTREGDALTAGFGFVAPGWSPGWTFQPFAKLSYAEAEFGAAAEPGPLGWSFAGHVEETLLARLGLRATHSFNWEGVRIEPRVEAEYVNHLLEGLDDIDASAGGGVVIAALPRTFDPSFGVVRGEIAFNYGRLSWSAGLETTIGRDDGESQAATLTLALYN